MKLIFNYLLILLTHTPIGYLIYISNLLSIKSITTTIYYTPLGYLLNYLYLNSSFTNNSNNVNILNNKIIEDVMKDNKFDGSKFNDYYVLMKQKRRDEAQKNEKKRLEKLKELDQEEIINTNTMGDYNTNMNGLINDVISGNNWSGSNRSLYLGITFIIISILGNFLIDVYEGYIKN